MKRITVDQFEGFDKMDVYFMDTENEEGIQELQQGLSYTEACDYIDGLIVKHQLNETDLIRNNYFDNEEYLIKTDKMTIKEYQEMEV